MVITENLTCWLWCIHVTAAFYFMFPSNAFPHPPVPLNLWESLSHRVGGNRKRNQQWTNACQKSIETVFLIAICRQGGDKWQSKTLFLLIFYLRSLIVFWRFRLPPTQCVYISDWVINKKKMINQYRRNRNEKRIVFISVSGSGSDING